MRKSDISNVQNCLVEIVNAHYPISSRHWELISASEGKLIINNEEKSLSCDLIDNPDSFLEQFSLQGRQGQIISNFRDFDNYHICIIRGLDGISIK